MTTDLIFRPPQTLIVKNLEPDQTQESDPELKAILKAFKQSTGAGLFALAARKSIAGFPPGFRFWHQLGYLYLSARCHDETAHHRQDLTPLDAEQHHAALERLIDSAPPLPGSESINTESLWLFWERLDNWLRETLTAQAVTLGEFLAKHAPEWHTLGRLFFHLAEHPANPDRPFAFMVTFLENATEAPDNTETPPRKHKKRGGKSTSAQKHSPLATALERYAAKQHRRALTQLLKPLHQAAEASPFLKELLDTKNIYHPQSWTPRQAHQFLQDAPLFEQAGITVCIPDWWQHRKKPQVKVTLDSPTKQVKGLLGQDQLLSFNISLALGDERLTAAERKALLAAETPLVRLRGNWVEVDSTRLRDTLAHWQDVERAHKTEGLSFIEGMRLLSGAPTALTRGEIIEQNEWAFADAGPKLKAKLAELEIGSLTARETKLLTQKLNATLRPYQWRGVHWLTRMIDLGLGACLADDMGLGKTLQVIAVLLLRKHQRTSNSQQCGPALIVLPTSLLANWQQELERFAPTLSTVTLHPAFSPWVSTTSSARGKSAHGKKGPGLPDNLDIALTTYGMVSRLKWLAQHPWSLVILDEAQAVKNPSTQQTKAVKALTATSKIALTGTPIENRLGDLWSLFDCICPGLLGSPKVFKNFVKQLETRDTDTYGPLRRLTKPYILRRLKTDKTIIADLPDKTEMTTYCHLSKKQVKLYHQLTQEFSTALAAGDTGIKRRGLVLGYLTRFKQVCNHPDQLLGQGEFALKESGKLTRLSSLCEEIAARQEKVLIFTQYRDITAMLADHLASIFGEKGLVLHGGTAPKSRQKMVDLFQTDESTPFMVLSLKAGGTGLNLTAANHVIHFDRWWNPAVENQATDRAFRIGQNKQVMVHKFVCAGTIEERIDDMIREKADLAEQLLSRDGASGASEQWITEMNNAQLMDLITLDIQRVDITG